MKLVKIPKRSGGWRTICVPSEEFKAGLRSIADKLLSKCDKIPGQDVVHGFRRYRSPVTNALAHVGRRYTLSFDLKDFFDQVTQEKLKGKVTKAEAQIILIDPSDGRGERALQGLPTSPAAANLAASDMDVAITKYLRKGKKNVVYTRYADDLSFSFDDPELIEPLREKIPLIVKRCGWQINLKKARLQCSAAGRRIITGVAVGDDGVYPTRRAKRALRAALYQAEKLGDKRAAASARGLREWCSLKLPKGPQPLDELMPNWRLDLEKLLAHWGLSKSVDFATERPQPEVIMGDFRITNDPVYILGASTFTTGWSSCLSHPYGQYRRTTLAQLETAGVSVAMFLSKREMNCGGVRRRVMRARAWVYTMRDGSVWHDRIYGNPDDTERLREFLNDRGIRHVDFASLSLRVVGRASYKNGKNAYYDSLRRIRATWRGKKCYLLAPR